MASLLVREVEWTMPLLLEVEVRAESWAPSEDIAMMENLVLCSSRYYIEARLLIDQWFIYLLLERVKRTRAKRTNG